MKTLRTRVCSARPLRPAFAIALLVALMAPAGALAHQGHEHGNVIANADGDNVRLRSGPGYAEDEINRYPEGTGVDIVDGPYDADDGSIWYEVNIDGQVGYMVSDFLVAIEVAESDGDNNGAGPVSGPTSGTATTNDSVFLRSGPSTADAIIRTLDAGEQVTLTGGSREGWTSVSATGGDGWVSSEFLAFPNSPTGTRSTIDTVHLRSGPGTTYESITYLDTGVQLELTGGQEGGFVQVSSSFGNGWVAAEYIGTSVPERPEVPAAPDAPVESDSPQEPERPDVPDVAEEPVARFTTANVNLRLAGSQTATVVTMIPASTEVEFAGVTAAGFSEVRTAAGDGWIASEFLSDMRPEAPSGPEPEPEPEPEVSNSLIAWPVSGDEWVISQGYNGSSHQNRTQSWQYYYSLDVKRSDGSTAGQPVSSAVNGTVRWIDEATGGMSIYMGNGLAYAFFHARLDPGIQEGDTVTQGQYLGTIAPAGEAASGSSAHLHITIWETSDEGNWSRRAIPFTGSVAIDGVEFPATGAGNDHLGYTFNP
ncbi:MAG: SH3 domain-containing protein [Thermomicrobiales bacterium]